MQQRIGCAWNYEVEKLSCNSPEFYGGIYSHFMKSCPWKIWQLFLYLYHKGSLSLTISRFHNHNWWKWRWSNQGDWRMDKCYSGEGYELGGRSVFDPGTRVLMKLNAADEAWKLTERLENLCLNIGGGEEAVKESSQCSSNGNGKAWGIVQAHVSWE